MSKQVREVGLRAPEVAIPVTVFTGNQVLGGLPFLEGAYEPALLFQAVGPLQKACSTRSWVRGSALNYSLRGSAAEPGQLSKQGSCFSREAECLHFIYQGSGTARLQARRGQCQVSSVAETQSCKREKQ